MSIKTGMFRNRFHAALDLDHAMNEGVAMKDVLKVLNFVAGCAALAGVEIDQDPATRLVTYLLAIMMDVEDKNFMGYEALIYECQREDRSCVSMI